MSRPPNIPEHTGKTPAQRRAYWLSHLTPVERAELEALEASIAKREHWLAAYVRAEKAALKTLKGRRQHYINVGNGRARYRRVGQDEWRAKRKRADQPFQPKIPPRSET